MEVAGWWEQTNSGDSLFFIFPIGHQFEIRFMLLVCAGCGVYISEIIHQLRDNEIGCGHQHFMARAACQQFPNPIPVCLLVGSLLFVFCSRRSPTEGRRNLAQCE